jgi:hypothetical protein
MLLLRPVVDARLPHLEMVLALPSKQFLSGTGVLLEWKFDNDPSQIKP